MVCAADDFPDGAIKDGVRIAASRRCARFATPVKKFAPKPFAPPMRASLAANFKNFPASRENARRRPVVLFVRNDARGDALGGDRARDVDARAGKNAAREIPPSVLGTTRMPRLHRAMRDADDDARGERDARGLARKFFAMPRRGAACARRRNVARAARLPVHEVPMHHRAPLSRRRASQPRARNEKAAQDKGFL